MYWSVTSCHMSASVSDSLESSSAPNNWLHTYPTGLWGCRSYSATQGTKTERERNRGSLCPWSTQSAQWPFAHSSSEESAWSPKKWIKKSLSLTPHFPYSFVLFEEMQALDFEEECVHVSVKAVDKQLWDVLRQNSLGFLSDTLLVKCFSLTSSLASGCRHWPNGWIT